MRKSVKITQEALLERVHGVYQSLAEVLPERQCVSRAECCQFLRTGKTPYLTKGEVLVLLQSVRQSGRTKILPRPDGGCPLLHPKTNRCTAYAGRPFGCRTHFCSLAGGTVPRKTVLDLIRQLEEIDGLLGGDGAHALPHALEKALREI